MVQEYVVRLDKLNIDLFDEILLNLVFLQQLGLVLLAQVLLAEGVHHVLQINAGSVDQLVGLKIELVITSTQSSIAAGTTPTATNQINLSLFLGLDQSGKQGLSQRWPQLRCKPPFYLRL